MSAPTDSKRRRRRRRRRKFHQRVDRHFRHDTAAVVLPYHVDRRKYHWRVDFSFLATLHVYL